MLAGRPHEAVGNGSPRWMTAAPRKRAHRTRPTGRLTPIHGARPHARGRAQPGRNFPANRPATAAGDSEFMSASQHVAPKGRTIKLNSLAAAAAVVAIVSGFGLTHHGAAAAVQHAKPQSISQPAAARQVPAADPSLTWLGSAGGQAQVTFNNDVSTLAWALEAESKAPTVANHLVFESDARVVRTP